jgi:hypothetical protein
MADAEITRAETRERARLLLVRSYDVDWDFTQGPGTDSADRGVHIFQPAPPLPTFTTTVVADDYHVVTAAHHRDTAERALRARVLPKVRD